MSKIYRLIGKEGRTTIPFDIRLKMRIGYNSLLSYEMKDENTIILRREKVCDHCKDTDVREGSILDVVNSLDGLTGYYRNYLYNDLGILTKEACLTDSNADDYTEKLLMLHPDALAEEYKKGEFQYFYASGGNGCRPTSLGPEERR